MHFYSAVPALSLFFSAAVSQYTLEDDYSASSFASMFEFFTGDDPTHGYVNYLSQGASETAGLYKTDGSSVNLGVDSTSVATGRGRDSVRVESVKRYNSGLFILDAAHMPEGCGTWPAFWLYGPNWPAGGEVDIIEGVNSQSANSFAAHTGPGCSISNTGFSGSISTPNCDINAPGQGTNVGCAIETSDTRSYGSGFNANGGGIYATEWTSEAISIWFFPRGSIPSDIASNPTPANWGLPSARLAAPCDIDQHFSDQRIVINTALCGDWAGAVWATDATCSSKAATCQDFVQNNPSAFQNAYWTINSLKVYQQGGVASPPVTTATTPVPTTLSTIAVTSTVETSLLPTTIAGSLTLTPSISATTPLAPLPPATQTSSFILPTTSLLPSTFLTSTFSIPVPTTSIIPPPVPSEITSPTVVTVPTTAETASWTSAWTGTPTAVPGNPEGQGQGWGGYGGGRGGGGGRWGGGPPGRRARL